MDLHHLICLKSCEKELACLCINLEKPIKISVSSALVKPRDVENSIAAKCVNGLLRICCTCMSGRGERQRLKSART